MAFLSTIRTNRRQRALSERMRVEGFLAMCIALAGLLSPLLAQTTTRPEEAGFSAERLRRVHETMQRHIDAGNISGAVTLLASRGRIVHFETHGLMDIESKRPMAKDAIFRIMSMTKPLTAVAVMMMEEEGKLRVEDKVSKYIPEFKELNVRTGPAGGATVAAVREITIFDLLTHTSGMGFGPADRKPEDTLASLVPRLAATLLLFQPGTEWEYSALVGPDVLARIVELVSGQSYDKFLRTRIFDPLGMKDTSYFPTDGQRPRLATVYNKTPNGLVPIPDNFSSRTYFSGSAGLLSTAEDYLHFAQMLANGGELNGKRLLKADTVRRMSTNHVGSMFNGELNFPSRGLGFGYLVAIVEDSGAAGMAIPNGSFGWLGAYGTQVWINPKEQLVTILMIQKPMAPPNLDYSIQRDFEAAAMQARVN